MRRITFIALMLTGCLLFGFIVTQPGWAQQKEKTSTSQATEKKPKFSGRLPDMYRQAGISVFQRKQIYEIQKKYHDQINALRKQLKELESKQDKEIEALLSDRQKADLAKLKKIRSKSKDKPKKPTATTKDK